MYSGSITSLVFIRATKTHSKAGKPAFSYRLVQTIRCGATVRQKTLLNLGTSYPIPKPLWPQVTSLASDLLAGTTALFAPDPQVLDAAEHLVKRLRQAGFSRSPDADNPVATVNLDTLQHEPTRSVGAERLCLHALEQLEFGNLLLRAGARWRDTQLATALVVARMLHPSSEREALRWLQHSSCLLELLGIEGDVGLSLSQLYRTNDLLWKHRQALQKGLFERERDLLKLSGTLVFYDLSNMHYTGRPNDTLRRFGRSKQKRSDCPLVSLALALDGAGFPRRCEVLPGNVSEPGTLKEALNKLAGPQDSEDPKPTVVLDAGIASEANLAWLGENGWDWIAVSRQAKPEPPTGEPAAVVRTQAGYAVRAWALPGKGGGEPDEADQQQAAGEQSELRVYAVSEARQRTAEAILDRQRERYEGQLQKLHEGLSKPHCLKNGEQVQRKIGRLAEQHSKVARHYEVTVTPGQGGTAAAVEYRRKPQAEQADLAAGAYVLRTSHADWDEQRVLRTYWQLLSSGLFGKAFSGLNGRRGAEFSGLLASGWGRGRARKLLLQEGKGRGQEERRRSRPAPGPARTQLQARLPRSTSNACPKAYRPTHPRRWICHIK